VFKLHLLAIFQICKLVKLEIHRNHQINCLTNIELFIVIFLYQDLSLLYMKTWGNPSLLIYLTEEPLSINGKLMVKQYC